ncbi:SLIT-ROBO Rho GTPase-activating protein 3 isoform X2 [Oryzias latipes]|uniref:Rho GTPase activating protein 4a n=2 Tax=Oryzias latipes TaxID=8090 RepID=A0A3B3I242_ORYLA|nr:SLIT-ROBO Rho GTPase-activating protein 3 isoform X2 [Oryzias latipes]XP_011475358.1 SLIT-ROBO Rho GTPase-activating protein 3 isoform X2 [Oryzias latipes]
MTSHVKLRKEKTGTVDYDIQIKEVRCQLIDQLKVLDLQLEQKTQQLQDLTDYLRRRGEIENEYARSLEKLAERFSSKTKRKDTTTNSVSQVWVALLTHTRQESKDHSELSESCSNVLIQPLTNCLDYTQRLARKSKDICTQLQDGLLKVTADLQTAWRTYHQYYSDYVCAEGKLREAEKQEEKQKQSAAKKLERLIEKRQIKVQELHLKCSKARNDYLLNMAAANSSVMKYFLKDISFLIDCADMGYHLSVGRVMQTYLYRWGNTQEKLETSLLQLQETVSKLDQSKDKEIILQDHYNAFSVPARFTYQPQEGDQVSEISVEGEMCGDIETRFKQIQTRLKAVTEETEETGRSMVMVHSTLLEGIGDEDLDQSSGHGLSQEGSTENLSAKSSMAKRRANMQETEGLYFTKVKEYLVGSLLMCKLQAKHDLLKLAVEKAESPKELQARTAGQMICIRKTLSNPNVMQNYKPFSSDMLSFIKVSKQQIPLVVKSCIRFINLNGLHHEGIFRVPGSQMEVNNLKEAFERGEDPLAEGRYNMDTVAGVLKLYFRGMENPLFPTETTYKLLELAEIQNDAERAAQLKMVISSYPEPIIIVMRYLFAFLHHVSQYSDENMMQPYNLAVCFGPNLVRGPNVDDFVTLQPKINFLVKNLIIQQESIFPSQSEVPGPTYEKCMTLEQDDCEPINEEGEVEDSTQLKDDLEKGYSSDNGTGVFLTPGNPKERPRANSSGSVDGSRTAGGGSSLAGKLSLQIPVVPQYKPRRTPSPTNIRKEFHQDLFTERTARPDKVVCIQMDSVFKELLSRRPPLEPNPTVFSVATKAQPKKGKRDTRKAM